MAYTGTGQKLVGDDGYVQFATFGDETAGDGGTALPAGTYLVTEVATSTGFPSASAGGTSIAAGDVLVVGASDTITPESGDNVVELTLTDQADISSWKMDMSKAEIDVTTLDDAQMKYRAGKADMTGSMTGVFTVGTTDASTGTLREFMDIANQDGDQSFDRFAQQENILLGIFYLNNDTQISDQMYVITPFQMYGQSVGGEIGSAQSFSSNFRFANKSYTDANDNTVQIQPTFYRLGDGS
jgi:hypothetical protein